ncbi:MAG: hypothetical protein ACFFEA_13630 [Candidatus Thorarchaeota archaeon]
MFMLQLPELLTELWEISAGFLLFWKVHPPEPSKLPLRVEPPTWTYVPLTSCTSSRKT